jgi:dihydrofolate reductase
MHNVDQESSQFALAQLREAGTLVFGRVTYEGMAAFWPTPAGEESDSEVAKAMNTTPKIVISRTLPQATWAGTQIISNHAEEELMRTLATARGGMTVDTYSEIADSVWPSCLKRGQLSRSTARELPAAGRPDW